MELFVKNDKEHLFNCLEGVLLHFGIGNEQWFSSIRDNDWFDNKMQNQVNLIFMYLAKNKKDKALCLKK